MGFIEEAAKNFGLNIGSAFSGFSLFMFDGKAVYIEGIKRLGTIGEGAVKVFVARGAVTVAGEDLRVKEISRDDVAVEGRITGVNIEWL